MSRRLLSLYVPHLGKKLSVDFRAKHVVSKNIHIQRQTQTFRLGNNRCDTIYAAINRGADQIVLYTD